MAIPAAVLAAGISAASTGASAYAQGKTNKKTREWNEMMYGRQRQDALDDWHMQNAYNSPAAQMARYKEAGLNPNLIYGQTNDAGPIRSAEPKSWNPQTPDYAAIAQDAATGIRAYQDYTLQQEQVKNMQAQRETMAIDQALKVAELAAKNLSNSKNRELYDTSIATANETLRSLRTSTDIKVSKELRDAAMHAPNLLSAFERVANIKGATELQKQQLQNLKNSDVLQKMEINMRKLGLSYSDGVILRMLAQFAGGQSLPDVVKNLWKSLQGMLDGNPKYDVKVE